MMGAVTVAFLVGLSAGLCIGTLIGYLLIQRARREDGDA